MSRCRPRNGVASKSAASPSPDPVPTVVIVCALLQLGLLLVVARMVLSWVRIPPQGALASVYQAVFAVTEPPLSAIRAVVPVVRMGATGLDLSPLVLLVVISLLSGFICR